MVLLQEELEHLAVDDKGAALAPLVEPHSPRLKPAPIGVDGAVSFAAFCLKENRAVTVLKKMLES